METINENKNVPGIKPETGSKKEKPFFMDCKSKTFKIVAMIIGLILIILVSFATGMGVGLRKAKFSYQWGKNYERNFVEIPMGLPMMPPFQGQPGHKNDFPMEFPDFQGRDFRNAHGLVGLVISISDNTVVIKDNDEKENTVSVTDETLIKRGRDTITVNDLKQDDRIVVLGKPDNESGTINADLIRVMNNPFNNNGQ